MNRIIKKITSLVVALTVALTSALVLNIPENLTAAAEGTHLHKACGGLAHEGCNHEDIVYEEFPTDIKEVTIASDKNYYLTRDLNNDDITRIYNLDNIKLNLCLNGHKIVTEKATFHSVNGTVLNICDCKGGGGIENTLRLQGVVQISDGAEANIYGGSFVGQMGSICIADSNDVVNIYGGNFISDEPVYMYNGTLSIYDGEFTSKKTCVTVQKGNISVYDGKFICTAETDDYKYIIDAWYGVTVNVFGGEMTCEKTMGIRLFDSDCVLNMSGGSISSCGAAVLTNGNNTPKVNISGGSLCSNSHATTISGGTLNMTGGTVSGFMGIGTDGEITGGTIKDCGYCGISVQKNCNVTIGGNAKFENNICDIFLATATDIFTVKDGFQNTAAVRVADDISEDIPRRITTDGTDENAVSKITSCDDKYVVKYDDSSKYLYLNYHVHEYDENFKYDENGHWQLCEKCGEAGEKTSHTWDNGTVTKQPSENETGVKTYTCTVCGAEKTEEIDKLDHTHTYSADWTSDEDNHWHAATCGHDVKSNEAEHNFGTPTVKPSTCTQRGSEEYICQTCGYKKTVTLNLAEHSFDGEWQKDENNHWKVCTVCNTEKSEATAHSWNDGEISEQPTENEAGVMLYTCAVCKATKTEPIAPLDHTHDWSDEWSKDDTYHWHDCLKNCGEKKNNAAHIWDDGTVTKQPTVDAEGEKTFECTVCGKIKTETLPPKDEPNEPDSGNITVDVQPGENAPNTELKTPFDELVDAVLTSEEQENIKNGIDIKIILIVSDATESVPTDDKAKIEAAIRGLSGYKLGQYLDLNLLKIIGNSEGVRITQTNKPITVTFEIPTALRGKAEYSVIRVHGGETDVLRDLDSAPNTVTIETDKFSTYALVYKEKNTPSNPSEGNTSGGNPGDSPNPPTSTPGESDNSGDTPSDDDNPPRDDSSDTTSSESKPTDEDNSDAASSDDSNVTSSDDGNPISSESDTSSNVSDHSPNESSPSEDNGNPSTGIAVSLIPLVSATAILTVAVKRKKK